MKYSIQLSIILIFLSFGSQAANDNIPLGARSTGMGNASVTLFDIWSVQNNQAGLAHLESLSAGIYYENKFMLPELGLSAFGAALPLKSGGTLALSYSMFGFESYKDSKLGLAYARKFTESFSGGIQLDYLNTRISEGYGSKGAIAVEAGVRVKLFENLILGAHVFNPTGAKLADYNDEKIPTTMKLGLGYTFNEKVILAIETEKNIDYPATFRAGIEYRVIPEVYLRGGISTRPVESSFGVGLQLGVMRINLSASYHESLGYSPQADLQYIKEK